MNAERISVLLIDDDEDDVLLTRELLEDVEEFDVDMEAVTSFDSALAAVRENRHDLYLLDYRLDRQSGLELLEQFVPRGPVIMLTGIRDKGTDLRALQVGASDYLAKDRLTADGLGRAMRYAIERRKFQQLLEESQERLNLALRSSNIGTWTWNMRDNEVYSDRHLLRLLANEGLESPSTIDALFANVHLEEREGLKAALQACLEKGAPLDLEFRVVASGSGDTRFIAMRGNRFSDDEGRYERFAGACWDVTEKRRDEMHRKLLLAELDHRVKNTLQLVLAIARQTNRYARSFDSFMGSFEGRILALAEMHSLLTKTKWQGISMRDMMRRSLQPYRGEQQENVTLSGPDLTVPPDIAQMLYLVIHELSTNAVKFGSLSTDEGALTVGWAVEPGNPEEQVLVLEWRETGGPAVSPPSESGFGTLLINQTVEYELGGRLELTFTPTGVVCVLRVPLTHQTENPFMQTGA